MSLSRCGNCNNGSEASWGSALTKDEQLKMTAKLLENTHISALNKEVKDMEKQVTMLAACLQNMLVEVGVIGPDANPSYIELCAAADEYITWKVCQDADELDKRQV